MKQMITTLPMKRHGMGNNAPRLMTLRDDCDASDEHYTGSTRAARQRSGEGREAGEAVIVSLPWECADSVALTYLSTQKLRSSYPYAWKTSDTVF